MTQQTTQIQWHVTADGTVIQSERDDGSDRVRYFRYPTTRRVELADLRTLDERLLENLGGSERIANSVIAVFVVGAIGGLLGWLVLPRLDVGSAVTTAVFAVSIPLLVIGLFGSTNVHRFIRRRLERIYLEQGLESSQPFKMKADEARAMIEAPGTKSGPRRVPGQ